MDRSSSSSNATVETLKCIVERCQRNEEYLRQLARRTRDERKKLEKILREHKVKPFQRVRFNLDEENEKKSPSINVQLDPMAHRCEKLLQRDISSINDELHNEILRLRLEQLELLRRRE